MGVTLSAGGALSWWRETLGKDCDEVYGSLYPATREATHRLAELAANSAEPG
jgi:hypothetical protein